MKCIVCGKDGELTRLGEVEAAFCYAHSPAEAPCEASLRAIIYSMEV